MSRRNADPTCWSGCTERSRLILLGEEPEGQGASTKRACSTSMTATYRAVFLAPYRHDATVPPKRGGSLPKISKRSMCSESLLRLRLNLNFMPGDIQLLPNHVILLS